MIARRGSIDPGDCTLTVSLFLSLHISLSLPLLSLRHIYARPPLSCPLLHRVPPRSFHLSFLLLLSLSEFRTPVPGGASVRFRVMRAPLSLLCRFLPSFLPSFPPSFLPSFLPFVPHKGREPVPGSKSKNSKRRGSFPFSQPDRHGRETVTVLPL